MTSKEVKQTWIDCRGFPGQKSCILSIGCEPERAVNDLGSKDLFIIIPGNPGLGTMYQDFMSTLAQNVNNDKISVWTFSYIGHETLEAPLLPTAPTYSLEDQIQHKIALLVDLVPSHTQVTLIGHSIGCKISMEIFKRINTHSVKDVYFLFPTIENMVSTVRGQQVLPWVTTLRLLAVIIMCLLSLIPDFLLSWIIRMRYSKASKTFLNSTLNFLNCNHLNNCLTLARNELETVLDLDTETIRNMIGKLHIYFGQADGWSPLTYRDNLLRSVPDFPESDAVVDKHDIPHAFVEFNSEITANVVADWINSRADK